MPGFDGTGPQGMGPKAGGGRGFCSPGTSTYAHGYINSAIRGAGVAEFPGEEEEVGLSAAVAADGLAEPSRLTRSNSTVNRTLPKQLNF